MSNLANITLRQEDYNNLLANGAFIDIKLISVKIMPDDSEIKENESYKLAIKNYKKARDIKETIAFNLLTNK
jgi:hypothetical protein